MWDSNESVLCRYLPLRRIESSVDPRPWLGARERIELARLKDAGRRRCWMAGRYLGKRVILEVQQTIARDVSKPVFEEIDICSTNADGKATAPRAFLRGVAWPHAISIAHTSRGVIVAASIRSTAERLGTDLVEPLELNHQFVAFWYSPDERERFGLESSVSQRRKLWACKEAAYKALNRGEGFSPRQIVLDRAADGRLTATHVRSGLRGTVDCWFVDGQFASLAVGSHGTG